MAPLRKKRGDGEEVLRRGEVEEDQEGMEGEEEEEVKEDEEDEADEEDEEQEEVITEYEKQRLKTIERNKAMLASLQLPKLASSLAQATAQPVKRAKSGTTSKSKGSGPRRRSERLKSVNGKSAVNDGSSSSDKSDSETESLSPYKRKRKDQEYEPTDEEDSLSESEDEMDEQEKEVLGEDASPGVSNGVDMDEEEYALQQALALSLGTSVEATKSPGPSKKNKRRSSTKKRAAESAGLDPADELEDNPQFKATPCTGKAKRKTQKLSNKRHFTEEEVDALFPFFDERGRGRLTLNDLERVSTTHDFTWSAEELLDMIHLFNRNHNGVLDLVDFRNVATRCNLIISG